MKELTMTDSAEEQRRDKTVADTFPASDPPANSGITGAEPPTRAFEEPNTDALPTGRPISDRYLTETAHQSQENRPEEEDFKADCMRKLPS
jgi:hypothetical protein